MAGTYAALKTAIDEQLALIQAANEAQLGAITAAVHNAMCELRNSGQIVSGTMEGIISNCVTPAIAAANVAIAEAIADAGEASDSEIDALAIANPE